MGILATLLGRNETVNALASPPVSIASTWGDSSTLTKAVLAEIYGIDPNLLPLSRDDAMTVPAVAKARHLIVSALAGLPLEALDSTSTALPPEKQPGFLYRTNTEVSPYDRLAATIDDCIFFGESLWLVERGALQAGAAHAPILSAEWCPYELWEVKDGVVYVNDVAQGSDDYVYFSIPKWSGLLTVGQRTLRGSIDTERAWVARMQSPMFMVELHQIVDNDLTQEEIDAYKAAWVKAYRAGNASVGYTPSSLEVKSHQGSLGSADLFLEGRNAIRADVGNFLNIPLVMLDGSLATATLTYSTAQGNRDLFTEQLKFWLQPIEQRLSLDDVVPRGQSVRFVVSEQTAATPPATDDAEQD